MKSLNTHYNSLQVVETASAEVIKSAYKSLAQKWHPDKNPENRAEAERISCMINEAYAVLSDPKRRREHDEWIKTARAASRSGEPVPPAETPRPAETLWANRYRDRGDGTVIDVQTGLRWMRFCLGQTWRGGACVGNAQEYAWSEAQEAIQALNGRGGYADCCDWRMPTKKELQTLVYCSNGRPKMWNDTGKPCEGDCESPTIHPLAFPNAPTEWFWSSSTYAYDLNYAWYVYFSLGGTYAGHKGDKRYVRLVRSES